jgi:alanyl-tRNA synthetase
MSSDRIRKTFLSFFEKRGHRIVPSSSLIPDDPSVLLTTAGMQQFKKYYTGQADAQKDFGTKNTASIQKSFRTSDIDQVGDESHLTFFEMLGNFSFGGYFKKEAIKYAYDFFREMSLPIDYVTIFGGDEEVPFDKESDKIWKELGINKIKKRGREDNFWGPTGNEGPCGPTTEIYVSGIEIWNIVFNEYYYKPDGTIDKLKQNGVDTGMGLERLAMIIQDKKNIFETDLFIPLVDKIPTHDKRIQRILADHLRASAHLIVDGVEPSNKDRGYILRRLLRRAIFHLVRIINESAKIKFDIPKSSNELSQHIEEVIRPIISKIVQISPYLGNNNLGHIESVIKREIGTSLELLSSIPKLQKAIEECFKKGEKIFPADVAFKLFSSYGIPPDFIKEETRQAGLEFSEDSFETELKEHREISRAGAVAKFGGHGIYLKTGEVTVRDKSELEKVTRLHTATHLLHAALRAVLGPEVQQYGSDITAERARFDFKFQRKLTADELKRVELWVKDKIKRGLAVKMEEMSYEEAVRSGALAFFKEKYPPIVKVYTMYDTKTGEEFSKELCGGPHVTNTGKVGDFKIIKEEAVGADTRRIRAIVL